MKTEQKNTRPLPPILPHDPQAEIAVLGAVLVNNEILPQVSEVLKSHDFYLERNAHTFSAMLDLYRAKRPIDFVTVADSLREKGLLKEGQKEYLSALTDAVITSAGNLYHAEIVKSLSCKRRIIQLAQRAMTQASDSASSDEILSDLETGIHELAGRRKGLQPFSPNETTILDFLYSDPPDVVYLLEDVLPRGIVGGIIGQGGVSKSFLEITLSVGLATGQAVLKYFKPLQPVKVLGLFAEDPENELHRRVHFTVRHIFPQLDSATEGLLTENLHLKSVMGQVKPLMKVEQGNPAPSEYFEWLKKTIEAHKGLDVLMLDPKSRFYGLDENSNDDNTAWVSALEELVRDYGLTILFSHHVSKASGGALNQSAARGGSALVDACRWIANLRTMDEATAKRYDLEDFRSYIEFDVSKSNYAPRLPATIYFKRSEHGVLVPVNLEFQRLREKASLLCSLLEAERKEGRTFTRQELIYRSCGSEIQKQMECKRKDLSEVLDYALREGWIETFALTQMEGAGRPKGVLVSRKEAEER